MNRIMPLEQSRSKSERMVPFSRLASWSRVLAEGQQRTWTAREKETYAIICALRKWSAHVGLQPIVVCTDHKILQISHKEQGNTPSVTAVRRGGWHETLARFNWNLVSVPGEDNTVADCLSPWAYLARKAWMDMSMHGDAEKTAEAKCIIQAERLLEEGEAKCFVVMGSSSELAQVGEAKVQAGEAQMMEEDMVRAIEGVQSVFLEYLSDDYANSGHLLAYWNPLSALCDHHRLEKWKKDGDKVEDLLDHWHNAQLMHPGRAQLQKDLESRFPFPPRHIAVLNWY